MLLRNGTRSEPIVCSSSRVSILAWARRYCLSVCHSDLLRYSCWLKQGPRAALQRHDRHRQRSQMQALHIAVYPRGGLQARQDTRKTLPAGRLLFPYSHGISRRGTQAASSALEEGLGGSNPFVNDPAFMVRIRTCHSNTGACKWRTHLPTKSLHTLCSRTSKVCINLLYVEKHSAYISA